MANGNGRKKKKDKLRGSRASYNATPFRNSAIDRIERSMQSLDEMRVKRGGRPSTYYQDNNSESESAVGKGGYRP